MGKKCKWCNKSVKKTQVCSAGVHQGEWHIAKSMCDVFNCSFNKNTEVIGHFACCQLTDRNAKCPYATHLAN